MTWVPTPNSDASGRAENALNESSLEPFFSCSCPKFIPSSFLFQVVLQQLPCDSHSRDVQARKIRVAEEKGHSKSTAHLRHRRHEPFFLIPLLLGRSVCRPWSSPAWLPSGSSSTRPPVLAPDVSVNSGPEQQIPGAGSSSLPFSWEEVCAGHGQVPHGSHLGPAAPASSTCS